MNDFEQMAGELTATVNALKNKKEGLKKHIEDDETEADRIDAELDILLERRKEI